MKNASLHEAESHLSALIESVLAGEDVVISREGRPLVRLIKYDPISQPHTLGVKAGLNRGSMVMANDFDEPLPDEFWGL